MQSLHSKNIIYALAGLCCMLVGVGIARFAYTPIMPLMIDHHWLNKLEAGYLGGINFLGYFLGAIFAKSCTHVLGERKAIQCALISCVISLFLCGFPIGFYWLDFWRFLAGFGGALLMVTTSSLIFSNTPEKLKGITGGVIFTGIGLGIVLSGTVIPYTIKVGLSFTWFILGLISLITGLFAWFNLPTSKDSAQVPHPKALQNNRMNLPFFILAGAYFLFGIGFTPHTLFLIEYIISNLHYSTELAGFNWSLFGIGTVVGTLSSGLIADRIGVTECLIAAYLIGILAILLIILPHNPVLIMLSSLLMGMLFLSIVSLSSAQLSEMVPHQDYSLLWGIMTAFFAVSQTLSAYGMSYLIHKIPRGYDWSFLISLTSLAIAAIMTTALIKR
ncbi:YbfB/YjiJ family MFS transporter [Legionella israelensis]|uniref:Putative sialic acid transporter n=2 Tax=Legionella israelensis TaxID=454 RepID=A0A0W0VXK8_9GAMM|nr:YbfB/YjiJ family MFS transporter [Legionella israelensis]KTD25028.1 putative sialic acid transporter [Legionella israelensis]QBS10598.1 YbfB/YjiJ family MFS transporter [Legionella israelensis]SCY19435.1 Predicted arabinose efflux permease, MFS family [Legionella israelensis DSM 19235]STX57543.1 Purine efflux pump PbuE [Legionella israelensis]